MTLALTWPIVGAVLCGALLHASWNALIKSGDDKALDTALIHVLGCAVGAVLVAIFGLPRREALPWLAASLVIHIGYYVTLVGAYRHGELGFAYPIMRGTAPLIVAVLSGKLIGEHLPPAAWLGVAGISGGVLLIGLTRSARGAVGTRRHALAYALANAAIIAAYTIVDGSGVRASGNAMQYVGAALPDRRRALLLHRHVAAPRRARTGRCLHAQALAGRPARLVRVARRLRDRALGDDAGADRLGGGAARDLGAVRGADRRRHAEGALSPAARPRHRRHRRRRDGAAPRLSRPTC